MSTTRSAPEPLRRGAASRVLHTVAVNRPRRLDRTLVGGVLALTAIGTVLLAAATYEPGDPESPLAYVERHLAHVGIALAAGAAVAFVDYRKPRAYAPIVFIASSVLLALVLSPLGQVVNGSRSWVALGPVQLQPSEFAKVGLVLMVAMLLGEPRDGETAPTSRDVLFSLGAMAVPLGLVMLQPDLGTGMVVGVTYLAMLTLSGAPLRWIAGMLACGVAAVVAVWWFGLLKAYQLARFTSFLDPSLDARGTGYNANQAMISVGSGGISGTGLFQGEQTAGRFVPEQHTDFIFTVAGEELGFVGGIAVIGLLALVLLRILRIAAGCEQPYARLVCVGVAAWFAFQGFINIGMTIGVTPITGIPLPFVSYGGSATIANMCAVGLVLGVHARDRGFE
ncbi:rod shape-determining protein RodA [Nocardiopsis sp. RSe5-2]|uniref:peptidoglycan glycosyltransferase n=1 Tax=Nocardiopsis endophytica TaxID=3018445 RepID=A0ABT4U0V4_9ACTN|nr:rod shape-determining protein RodA [Nocardiopsis endophytica]MDA2810584.1 rod shape-determining protein RodA [Nocardiopsis endophytica]